MAIKLDESDIAILALLRDNSNVPLKDMSAKIGVHPNTIMKRVSRIEDEGIIRGYKADIDYAKLGYDTYAIVSIKIDDKKGEGGQLQKMLCGIPEVVALHDIAGENDSVAIIRVRSREELLAIIKMIRSHNCVISTVSQQVWVTYKTAADYNPLKRKEK